MASGQLERPITCMAGLDVFEPGMLQVDRQAALSEILSHILLCPGPALIRRSACTRTLVAAEPGLAEPLHVALEIGDQSILSPTVRALSSSSVMCHKSFPSDGRPKASPASGDMHLGAGPPVLHVFARTQTGCPVALAASPLQPG